MKKLLLKQFFTSLLFFTTITSFSQNHIFDWAKAVGTSGGMEVATSIKADAQGNSFICGYFSGTTDLDPGSRAFYVSSTSISDEDIFILKLDPAGNFLWGKTISSPQNDRAYSLAIDLNSNVYVTGYVSDNADLDPGTGVFNITTASGYKKQFTLKLSSTGNFVWGNNTSANVIGASIALDVAGNIYTTGSTDPTSNPGNSGQNTFIQKLNSSGNLIWNKKTVFSSSGSGNDSYGTSIIIDKSNNIYVAGYNHGTSDFDPSSSTNNLTCYGNFILKLDFAGNFIWVNGWYSTNSGSSMYNNIHVAPKEIIALDKYNNIYLTGSFYTTIDFDPGAGTHFLSSGNNDCGFIVKLDNNGSFVWAIKNATNTSDNIIFLDTLGNIYCMGSYYNNSDFDPGSNTVNLPVVSGTQNPIFMQKLDNAGNFIWAKSSGNIITYDPLYTLADNTPTCFFISENTNDIYTCGQLFSQTGSDFDPGPGVFSLLSQGNWGTPESQSAFIQKFAFCNTPPAPTNTSSSNNLTICSGNSTTLSVSGSGTLSWYSAATGGNYLGSGASFTTSVLNANTTYYVQDSTCESGPRLSIVVTVNPSPVAAITASGSLTFCSNTPTTLTSNVANSYLWSNLATTQSIIPNVSGNYFVTVTAANGCTASSSPVAITVNQTPAVLLQPQNQSVASGSNAQFFVLVSPSANVFYQWQQNAGLGYVNLSNAGAYTGANNDTLKISSVTTALNNSLYRCIYTNILTGCSDTSTIAVLGVGTIGINETFFSNIKIYPNPTSGIITINTNTVIVDEISITDIVGKTIFTQKPQNTAPSIDLTDYKSGIYFVKIISENKMQTFKIVKH